MSITLDELKKTAQLAYLDQEDAITLLSAFNNVLDQIDQLRNIDTQDIAPLTHPIPVTQPLREDKVITSSIHELAAAAPIFIDHMYSVPTVIKG